MIFSKRRKQLADIGMTMERLAKNLLPKLMRRNLLKQYAMFTEKGDIALDQSLSSILTDEYWPTSVSNIAIHSLIAHIEVAERFNDSQNRDTFRFMLSQILLEKGLLVSQELGMRALMALDQAGENAVVDALIDRSDSALDEGNSTAGAVEKEPFGVSIRSDANSLILLDYPRAKIAIEYREDIRRDWEEIRLLGEESAIAYLTDLDENPDLPAYKLWARMVHEYESRQVPFDNENTQEKYDVLGDAFGLEAQIKFREVRDVLGSAFDADDVFEKIYTEFNGKRSL